LWKFEYSFTFIEKAKTFLSRIFHVNKVRTGPVYDPAREFTWTF